jgi:nucleosome binding factor SPN SPT16 subunit
MAPKEEGEVLALRRAAHLSSVVLEKVVLARIEATVDEEGRVKHSQLADAAMHAAEEPASAPVSVKLRAENVELCYPFIIQSGGGAAYDLRWSAGSDDKALVYEPMGIIVCQLGCRYKSYCANVGRTYLIDPPRAVSDAYAALLAAHAAASAALREGSRCADVHAAAVAALAASPGGAALVPQLSKSLGAALGLEFREAALTLSPKCDALLAPGMVFNLATGLADVVDAAAAEGAAHRTFSLLLADTLVVTPGGAAPELLTAAKSALSDISYEINEQARDSAAGGLLKRRVLAHCDSAHTRTAADGCMGVSC